MIHPFVYLDPSNLQDKSLYTSSSSSSSSYAQSSSSSSQSSSPFPSSATPESIFESISSMKISKEQKISQLPSITQPSIPLISQSTYAISSSSSRIPSHTSSITSQNTTSALLTTPARNKREPTFMSSPFAVGLAFANPFDLNSKDFK
ncbi:uncharacterized protein MONOS_13099 [Monocercomonoides exilis]|uniref:uncharacterized protein n=1 Tax=Monocercomonoides exilis TaxID=2049356 RepID=UPI00355A4CD0|nr:hypothetical protein MONOS_13099 [Monocercomonoides exilis]|eukprot:MONOS_13099.1-p1 / transcript=MONOS_13099.1 / gene=MONOS_13099 / organism=Monocercomonoides_exilis_PA203 / gene_product=unspecified product / transcript_product=unspecified product / location=Mono_scaffold00778:1087-1530(+) / protein_length=148 / sequence_SO=supercontig / SO=protein_coding / is_pseudo=false